MLASETDIFAGDSLGTSHRATGGLMERQLAFYSKLLRESARPQAVLIGSSDIERKPCLIRSLAKLVDRIFVARAVTFTFIVACGYLAVNGDEADERRSDASTWPAPRCPAPLWGGTARRRRSRGCNMRPRFSGFCRKAGSM